MLSSLPVEQDTIELPRSMRTFALEVRGNAMSRAGIFEKDIVIFELAPPKNGEIVAALLDGFAIIRRFIIENGKPFLRADNPEHPELVPADELRQSLFFFAGLEGTMSIERSYSRFVASKNSSGLAFKILARILIS